MTGVPTRNPKDPPTIPRVPPPTPPCTSMVFSLEAQRVVNSSRRLLSRYLLCLLKYEQTVWKPKH